MNNLKLYQKFTNESKVATEESPLGFYTIANAVMPTEFFKKLDGLGIKYTHDKYKNFIEVMVNNEQEGTMARNIALSGIFEADDIEEEDLPYMTPSEIGDAMEIRMKKSYEEEELPHKDYTHDKTEDDFDSYSTKPWYDDPRYYKIR